MKPSAGSNYLADIEQKANELAFPFLRTPTSFRNPEKRLQLLLETFTFLNRILLVLHQHGAEEGKRNPTLKSRYITWLHTLSENDIYLLDEHLPQMELGNGDEFEQLMNLYDFWKDKLAGLFLAEEAWEKSLVDFEIPKFGKLSGSDWLIIIKSYLAKRQKLLEELD